MSDRKLNDLANDMKWPALIKELEVDAAVTRKQQLLYVNGVNGWCVFMWAALGNAPAPVMKALVEAALVAGLDLKAILTRVDNYKFTVLHIAACKSSDEVASCFACLCPSALEMKDCNNETPLEYAKYNKRPSSIIAALSQVS